MMIIALCAHQCCLLCLKRKVVCSGGRAPSYIRGQVRGLCCSHLSSYSRFFKPPLRSKCRTKAAYRTNVLFLVIYIIEHIFLNVNSLHLCFCFNSLRGKIFTAIIAISEKICYTIYVYYHLANTDIILITQRSTKQLYKGCVVYVS